MAGAEPNDPLVLDWTGPRECPDSATIQREVLELAQLTAAHVHHVTAVARVTRKGDTYRLILSAELDGSSGQRAFDGQSCDSVADAAVLTLALMLNPDAEIGPASSPVPSEPAGSVRGEPLESRESALPAVSGSAESVSLDSAPWPTHAIGGVTGGLRTGVLPDVAVELGLGAGVLTGPLSLTLAGAATLRQSAPVPESQAAHAELWLLSLAGLAGWHTSFDQLGFGLHTGVDWTRASGRGVGVSDPKQAHIHWLSVQVGGSGTLAVTEQIELGTGVFGLVPLARPRFTLEELGAIYRPQPFGIRAYFGVFVKLP